jgi:hypothetical protein
MHTVEMERLAAEVRQLAGLDDDDLLLGPAIAALVVGPENVLLSDCDVGARLEGRRIVVPRKHPDISFAFCHELAELMLHEHGHTGDHLQKERAANYIACAIQAPPATVRRAHAQFGERLPTIARVFGISKTSAHLRLREVLGDEGAIVTRTGNVLVRNARAVDWASPGIRTLDGDSARFLGLKRSRLRGGIDRGRVALRVA